MSHFLKGATIKEKNLLPWEQIPLGVAPIKGKGNIERKYIYQDRTFQAKQFDTNLIKIS